jgi:hypothetical protein
MKTWMQDYDRERNTLTNIPLNGTPFTERDGTAYRAPHPLSDVAVPGLLAVISGVIAAAATFWLTWELDWSGDWVPLVFFAAVIGVWIWQLGQHNAHLQIEQQHSHADPPPPPQAKPSGPSIEVTLSQPTPTGKRVTMFTLPGDEDAHLMVAEAMLAGSVLPENEWAGLTSGRPFSEDGLKTFKGVLVAQGLAEWKSPKSKKSGVKLTTLGTAYMKDVVRQAREEDK